LTSKKLSLLDSPLGKKGDFPLGGGDLCPRLEFKGFLALKNKKKKLKEKRR